MKQCRLRCFVLVAKLLCSKNGSRLAKWSGALETPCSENENLIFLPQGLTNTVGAVPGIVGVALTGYLLDSTHSWSVSNLDPL